MSTERKFARPDNLPWRPAHALTRAAYVDVGQTQRGGATVKNATRLSMSNALAISALVLATNTAMAQDPAQVAGQNYKVLFENDRVRVLEYRSKPGERAAMHVHPDYLVYDLVSGYKVKFTTPDGKTAETPGSKAGTVTWRGAETHATENVGTTDAHVLIIELKK